MHLDIKGLKHNLTQGEVIILSSPEGIDKENSLTSPDIIKPEVESIEVRGKTFDTVIPAKTFAVYILK